MNNQCGISKYVWYIQGKLPLSWAFNPARGEPPKTGEESWQNLNHLLENPDLSWLVIQDIQAIRRWHETLFDMFPIPLGHHGSPLVRLSLAAWQPGSGVLGFAVLNASRLFFGPDGKDVMSMPRYGMYGSNFTQEMDRNGWFNMVWSTHHLCELEIYTMFDQSPAGRFPVVSLRFSMFFQGASCSLGFNLVHGSQWFSMVLRQTSWNWLW